MKTICPKCGTKLQPSNFPDIKKASGQGHKFENGLVCKNFPECEDAEPN